MSSNSYSAIKDRISEACDMIQDGWYSTWTQVAKVYQASFCCLEKKWKGGVSKCTQGATNKVLMEALDDTICVYINCSDEINMFARLKMIFGAANYFIRFENRIVDRSPIAKSISWVEY